MIAEVIRKKKIKLREFRLFYLVFSAFSALGGELLRILQSDRETNSRIYFVFWLLLLQSERNRLEGNTMKIEYSKNVDALYIKLREAKITDSIDIEEGVTADLDENGHIVRLEILDASEKLDISDLVNISIENLPLEKVT